MVAHQEIRIEADGEYAKQHEALNLLKIKSDEVREEYLADVNKLKAEMTLEKIPITNKMREIYKSVPNVWSIAFANSSIFDDLHDNMISEFVGYVTDFEVIYNSDVFTGGKIILTFAENPFMTNTQLYREISSVDGTPKSLQVKYQKIDWKEGKKLGPVKDTEHTSAFKSFINWLEDENVLDIDHFLMMEFYHSSYSFLRDLVPDYDEFSDEEYQSGEEQSYDEGSDDISDDDLEHEKPAAKKSKLN